jgi:hypothetical protein
MFSAHNTYKKKTSLFILLLLLLLLLLKQNQAENNKYQCICFIKKKIKLSIF